MMKGDITIAVVFRNNTSLIAWKHNYGDLVLAEKHPLGDRLYRDENGSITHLKFFHLTYDGGLHKIRGYIFDKVIMLDSFSGFTVSWLKSIEQRKPTMKTLKRSKFKNQIWRGECHHCDALFECERKEIEVHIKSSTRMGMRDGPDYALLSCLECSKPNVNFKYYKTVEPMKVPDTTEER